MPLFTIMSQEQPTFKFIPIIIKVLSTFLKSVRFSNLETILQTNIVCIPAGTCSIHTALDTQASVLPRWQTQHHDEKYCSFSTCTKQLCMYKGVGLPLECHDHHFAFFNLLPLQTPGDSKYFIRRELGIPTKQG